MLLNQNIVHKRLAFTLLLRNHRSELVRAKLRLKIHLVLRVPNVSFKLLSNRIYLNRLNFILSLNIPVPSAVFGLSLKMQWDLVASLHSGVALLVSPSKPVCYHVIHRVALLKLSHFVYNVVEFQVCAET